MVKEFETYTAPLSSKIEMPLCKAIVGVLRGSHIGKNKSIKSEAFAAILSDLMGKDINVRTLRQGISILRMHGEPICSWCCGYYYLDQSIEFNSTIQSLTDRMIALAAEVAAMSDKYVELFNKNPIIKFKDLKKNIGYLIQCSSDQELE